MTTVAIVTPWLDHKELWPDYEVAISVANADEIWIVDNGSTPPLEFATLRLDTNEGFCGGSNAGLHVARTDVVVFLNNDISLGRADWLDRIVGELEPGSLVGARMRRDPHTVVEGKVMPYLDGWCLAGYRDELLEIGGWDVTLDEPGYFSDNLLCLEARAHGLRLLEVPVGLHHKRNQTITDDVEKAKRATVSNHERYLARARELMSVPA